MTNLGSDFLSHHNNMISATSTDFQHDSEWFIDYGSTGVNHPSVLSSLSASYTGIGELSFYDDLAKNIDDVDLAEIDMESFRTEDIHNLLKQRDIQQGEDNRLVTSSIYRSEVLFSPVHESVHLSIDSLDMNYPTEEDIILTCKANKDNYTIAFEGSIAYSDVSSFYGIAENQLLMGKREAGREFCERSSTAVNSKKSNLKMSTSDYNLTTWSKLKKTHNSSNLNRILTNTHQTTSPVKEEGNAFDEQLSSGGGMAKVCSQQPMASHQAASRNEFLASADSDHIDSPVCLRRTKSLSEFYSLKPRKSIEVTQIAQPCEDEKPEKLNVSQAALHNNLNHNFGDSANYSTNKLRSLLPNCAMPIQQLSQTSECASLLNQSNTSNEQNSSNHSSNNANGNQAVNQNSSEKPPSFSLVKLFIKQKSSSSDTCMDVSSGCWPSDSSSSLEHPQQANPVVNNNIINRNYHKKSVSNLARHDEEEYLDSLDAQINNNTVGKSKILNVKNAVDQNKNFNILNNNSSLIESNNNLINNLINNNHLSTMTDQTTDTTSHSRTSDENITQIYNNLKNNQKHNLAARIQMDKITRSMQTSIPKLISSATQYNKGVLPGRNRVKIVPMSFLKQLHKNDRKTAPVYVIYPNYTLPNLDFVNRQDFILSPIEYKDPFMGMAKDPKAERKKPATRPKSFNDILDYKRSKVNYQDVTDWKSLIFLLPMEYSRILKSIPEIENELLKHQEEACDDGFEEEAMTTSQSQKPLFCTTTPVLRRQSSRPLSCDCVHYVMQSSSSSSSSNNHPNSSGYRGSSTIMTDSELEGNLNMVYDDMENAGDEDKAGLPPLHCGRTPKGILRRNGSRSKPIKPQNKRNSLFDGTLEEKPVEKRRSLQEIPDQNYMNYSDDVAPKMNPLLNYKQQCNDLGSLSKFKKKLNNELELLEGELMDRNIPRSDSKYYNEIGHILESLENLQEPYDRLKLRNNVSRALSSQQKRVSFTEASQRSGEETVDAKKGNVLELPANKMLPGFTTPPNSPNISIMGHRKSESTGGKKKLITEKEKQDRIQSNRFKRLQIQWELLSKDSQSLMKEMNENCPAVMETKSGGSTPTGAMKSRIPRPVSYPATRTQQHEGMTPKPGTSKCPGRIATPKKYGFVQTPPSTPKQQNRLNNTPKKSVNSTQTRMATKSSTPR